MEAAPRPPAFVISPKYCDRRDIVQLVTHIGPLLMNGSVMGDTEWLNQCKLAGVTGTTGLRFLHKPGAYIKGKLIGPDVLKFYIELVEVDCVLAGYPSGTPMYTVNPGWSIDKV